MENQDIRIRLRAYDSKLLDTSTSEIINTAKRTINIQKKAVITAFENKKLYFILLS